MDKRDQDEDVERFKELFWEQFPIEGDVKFNGHLVMRVLQAIDGLEDSLRNEGMYPYV